MKVLLVGFPYAVPNQLPKLRSIAAQGIDINVLAPGNWPTQGVGDSCCNQVLPEELAKFGAFLRPAWRSGHIASHAHSPLAVWRILTSVRPDLVHIENEGYSYLAGEVIPIAKALRIKTTLFVWENIDKHVHWTQRACLKIALRGADGLVCGSTGAESQYRRWGFRGPTSRIPQLGVDTDLFQPSRKKREGPFIVGYVGRLVPEKGIDVLLRAVRILVQQGIDIRCLICGAGPEHRRLEALATELGIQSATSFLNAVRYEIVPNVLSRLDVLVLPSRTAGHWAEQLGHILLEAMSIGAVAVGSRSGAIPEVIGKDELLFRENDASDLARILNSLATDTDFYEASREFGRRRVQTHYTHHIVGAQLAAFWRSIGTETA